MTDRIRGIYLAKIAVLILIVAGHTADPKHCSLALHPSPKKLSDIENEA